MRIKICGITQPEQGQAIAQMGASALGFICVRSSPRYVTPEQIRAITTAVTESTSRDVLSVGVFADESLAELNQIVKVAGLNAVQLHGHESPDFCQQVRSHLPSVAIIKAFRIRSAADLAQIDAFTEVVDALLLDAYHPHLLGGTGKTLDWDTLRQFQPPLPWFLAGGLTPENVQEALAQLQPSGIDLSSGVERSPGDKDLTKVAKLFEALMSLSVSRNA